MACFIAPMVEAIAVTIVKKSVQKKESIKLSESSACKNIEDYSKEQIQKSSSAIPWSRKLGWLQKLLFGGVFLLMIEHIWHGEVVPYPPFLTAMNNPADIEPMLMEILTVGCTMAAAITLIWGVMVLVADHIVKKADKADNAVKSAQGRGI